MIFKTVSLAEVPLTVQHEFPFVLYSDVNILVISNNDNCLLLYVRDRLLSSWLSFSKSLFKDVTQTNKDTAVLNQANENALAPLTVFKTCTLEYVPKPDYDVAHEIALFNYYVRRLEVNTTFTKGDINKLLQWLNTHVNTNYQGMLVGFFIPLIKFVQNNLEHFGDFNVSLSNLFKHSESSFVNINPFYSKEVLSFLTLYDNTLN